MPNDKTVFAQRLRSLRTEAGLTQQQLADAVECTREEVARWESGRFRPRWEDVERLAQALGVPVCAFGAAGACSKRRAKS